MPSHQDRREPLPKGYQFGDCGYPRTFHLGDRLSKFEILTTVTLGHTVTRQVTKGQLFDTPTTSAHKHTEAAFDAVRVQSICRCGARLNVHGSDINSEWFTDWNVIEGETHGDD